MLLFVWLQNSKPLEWRYVCNVLYITCYMYKCSRFWNQMESEKCYKYGKILIAFLWFRVMSALLHMDFTDCLNLIPNVSSLKSKNLTWGEMNCMGDIWMMGLNILYITAGIYVYKSR